MQQYNYVVIGNGLMGSAAARYLSDWSDSVALIGPGEPADQSSHDGVFSSHYDEGRLAHKYSQDPIWAVIAREAVQQYPYLQQQSGVHFHGPVGRAGGCKSAVRRRADVVIGVDGQCRSDRRRVALL